MKTSQPSYFCIANLGDVNPFEHGGAFVCIDRRGIYDPILLIYDQDFYRRSEITLERCHKILSNTGELIGVGTNRFHPKCEEWFSNSMQAVANFSYNELDKFVDNLTSNNVVERAQAYLSLIYYHGVHEFDHYPFVYENVEDAELFCSKMLEQLEDSESWHDGYFKKSEDKCLTSKL